MPSHPLKPIILIKRVSGRMGKSIDMVGWKASNVLGIMTLCTRIPLHKVVGKMVWCTGAV